MKIPILTEIKIPELPNFEVNGENWQNVLKMRPTEMTSSNWFMFLIQLKRGCNL